MTAGNFRLPPLKEGENLVALRQEVRAFLKSEADQGRFKAGPTGWANFDPEFSQRLAQKGWIGMTWPKKYGGGERTPIERHIVTEELLSAGAPVRAHWVADRQSGPLLLKFGKEEQRQRYLPEIAAGRRYFCIGMSEADSGSDLASIRTKAVKVDGGWLINGAKLWTSNAHRVHTVILFARTGPAGESRHEGVSQFLVDLDGAGISIRPIVNLAGEHDFNEVVFRDVFVPDGQVVGEIGNGWNQVTSELVYERSGPDRWLSTFQLLPHLVDQTAGMDSTAARQGVGRLVAHLWTMHHMSLSIAGLVARGASPHTEAALVKDLGTQFEREIPDVARMLVPETVRAILPEDHPFEAALRFTTLNAPALTIRGGTREILRGIIAKSLGMR
ncbi:acyl-CoA dehydrogenase family protein [Noviherbaspirillum sp. Root189]|uniref:acyl-CoA dehydrogenase family protein n=1 Tax=Noviherbaspirillum sp. Root189 TaxID=1736487 RepID=UPI00070A07DE|nr:acyl-CoA dehydrogenase family protein [Noviherbaspirillum sp. Root189]KRB75743.1 acyl-CoA dehydrogenase [Noviherbaspirillum sp. Root189]